MGHCEGAGSAFAPGSVQQDLATRGHALEVGQREVLDAVGKRCVLEVPAIGLAVRHKPLEQEYDGLALGLIRNRRAHDDPAEASDWVRRFRIRPRARPSYSCSSGL